MLARDPRRSPRTRRRPRDPGTSPKPEDKSGSKGSEEKPKDKSGSKASEEKARDPRRSPRDRAEWIPAHPNATGPWQLFQDTEGDWYGYPPDEVLDQEEMDDAMDVAEEGSAAPEVEVTAATPAKPPGS